MQEEQVNHAHTTKARVNDEEEERVSKYIRDDKRILIHAYIYIGAPAARTRRFKADIQQTSGRQESSRNKSRSQSTRTSKRGSRYFVLRLRLHRLDCIIEMLRAARTYTYMNVRYVSTCVATASRRPVVVTTTHVWTCMDVCTCVCVCV